MAIYPLHTTTIINKDVLINSPIKVFNKFTVVPAVRDKFRMWNGDVSDSMIQDYSDSPTETGTTTLTDQEFTIAKKSIFHGVPYDLFKDTEFNVSIADMKSQGLPEPFVNMVADLVGKKAGKFAAQDIYNGEGGLTGDPTGGVDGLAKLIKDKLTAASLTNRIVTSATLDPTDPTDIKSALDAMKAEFSVDMIEMKDEATHQDDLRKQTPPSTSDEKKRTVK